jgi:hypothetical protein
MSTAATPGYLAAASTGSWNRTLQAGATLQRGPIRALDRPLIPLANLGAIECAQTAVSGLRKQSEPPHSQAHQEPRPIAGELHSSIPLEASDSVGTATPNVGEKVKIAQVLERTVQPTPGRSNHGRG